MADKTEFEVTMALSTTVPLAYVDSATLQKDENAIKGTKTLGVTTPKVTIPVPTLEWKETPDQAKGGVILAITKVKVAVSITATVKIDKAIDKKSDCHQHVYEHEKRHLKTYRDGAAGQIATIKRAVDKTAPQLKAPVSVATKDVASFKERAQKRVEEALDDAVIAAMNEIRVASLAIHTPDELKKTNGVCATYLKKP
jgi:hypothetical protein